MGDKHQRVASFGLDDNSAVDTFLASQSPVVHGQFSALLGQL
jgi:hypothetical protein